MPSLLENMALAHQLAFPEANGDTSAPADLAIIGLSGLWRLHTSKNGKGGSALNSHLDSVPARVALLLTEHDLMARQDEAADLAIFGFIDSTVAPLVSQITARVVQYWEKGLWRNEQPLIFESARPIPAEPEETPPPVLPASKEAIVLEVAAAVMETLPVFTGDPLRPRKDEEVKLARLIAYHGPKFVQAWMDGSYITEWALEQGMQPEAVPQFLKTFNYYGRKQILATNPSDPLAALQRIKANVDLLENAELVARYLGCREQDYINMLNRSYRKRIAFDYVGDPLKAVARVKANIELLSDSTYVADRIGCSRSEVVRVLTPSVCLDIAVHRIADPLSAVDRIKHGFEQLSDIEGLANVHHWNAGVLAKILTPATRLRFAASSMTDPVGALRRYAEGKLTYAGKRLSPGYQAALRKV